MKITVQKWLIKHGHDPAQSGLVVYTGRLIIPRAIWGNALADDSAQLKVEHQ